MEKIFVENLKLKTAVAKIKSSLVGLNSRMGVGRGKSQKLEDKTMEIVQSEKQGN